MKRKKQMMIQALLIVIVMVVQLFIPCISFAEEVKSWENIAKSEIYDVRATLYSNGLLEITGAGEMKDWSDSDRAPWYDYRESITGVTIGYGVESIGAWAFWDCNALTSITIETIESTVEGTIESTVASIGYGAFWNCNGLTSITIPSSVESIGDYAFESCNSLTNITIPSSVESIGDYAFESCNSLTNITISEGVTSIGGGAFENCNGLTSITIPSSVESIGDYAFENCNKLTKIEVESGNSNYISDDGILFNNDKTEIICYPVGKEGDFYKILESVTSIRDLAFYNCDNLISIENPDGVTSIGNYAFAECDELRSITIPSSVESIGDSAFSDCEFLIINCEIGSIAEQYAIDNNITYAVTWGIGEDVTATLYSDGLLEITGTGAMEEWSAPSSAPWYNNRESIKEVRIGDGVTSIGRYAFAECKNLTSITIPKSVTSIENSAFMYCNSLTSINVEQGNSNYVSDEDGILFNKDKTEIICYPAGKTETNYKIPDGVTSIGMNAFYSCDNLTSIDIPNSVTSIGDSAFGNCKNLESIQMSEEVTSIGSYAFYNCGKLISIVISKKVTSIGEGAFEGCNDLIIYCESGSTAEQYAIDNDITYAATWNISKTTEEDRVTATLYSDGLLEITGIGAMKDWSIFNRAPWYNNRENIQRITIGDGVTSIGSYAFHNCDKLESITIPSSVTSIGSYAFSNCEKLKNINVNSDNLKYSDENGILFNNEKTEIICYPAGKTETEYKIPNGVTSIKTDAFYNCNNLISIEIPYSVTSIEDGAFSYCDKLESITIPSSVESIGDGVFSGCNKLTSINVDSDNSEYSDENGILFNNDKKEIICYPAGKAETAYTIPDGVTSIGSDAFYNCDKLESITIPKGVASIGDRAFYNCDKLESITIPEGVVSIGILAFSSCNSLTSVIIPSSVTSIEYAAFRECTSLTSITIPEGVISIRDYAFEECTSLTNITIPSSVTSIEYAAFRKCTSLTSITIPSSVESIGTGAFEGCNNLTIYCESGSTAEQYAIANSINYVIISTKTLSSIAITTRPTKTSYVEGEAFDKTGMVVTATYSDGTTSEVTNYTIDPSRQLATSDNKVTISYTENGVTKTVEQTITVTEASVEKTITRITLSKVPNKTKYTQAKEELNVEGGQVKAIYSDGTEETVNMTNDMVTGFDNTKLGKQTLTIRYGGKTITYEVEIIAESNNPGDNNPSDTPGDNNPGDNNPGDNNPSNTPGDNNPGDNNPSDTPGDNNPSDNGTNNNSENNTNEVNDNSTVKKEVTGEDTTSKDKIPYTGTTIKVILTLLGLASIATFVAYRKYKNI